MGKSIFLKIVEIRNLIRKKFIKERNNDERRFKLPIRAQSVFIHFVKNKVKEVN